jgi:hypothetical protein
MLEKVEGPANKLLKTAQNWTSKVDTAIDRIPNMGGLLSGFKKSLQSWVNLFSSASRRSMGVRRLMVNKTPQEQMKLVQGLEAALKREKFLDPTILGKPNILQRFLYCLLLLLLGAEVWAWALVWMSWSTRSTASRAAGACACNSRAP